MKLEKEKKYSSLGANFQKGYFILLAGDDKNIKKENFSKYYLSNRIDELRKNGVGYQKLCEYSENIGTLHVFGWVLKMWDIT